jgi:AraC-like DNA-binding protein
LRRLNRDCGNAGFSGRIERSARALADKASVFSAENAALLEQAEMLSGFALAFIVPQPQSGAEETDWLYDWEKEIIRRLAASFFSKHLVFSRTDGGEDRTILVFIWNLPRDGWEIRADIFKEQLKKTSVQITGLDVRVIFSRRAENRQEIGAWRNGLPSFPPPAAEKKPDTAAGHAGIIAKAKQYILDNLDRPIALRDVADHAAISPGYLSTIFKKELNQNLMGYINMIKIERACALLRQGKYRIYEISYMLGFENAYYFTRVFRRYAGVSPSEYQKKIFHPSAETNARARAISPMSSDGVFR